MAAELRGVKFAQFSDFGPFLGVTSQNDSNFSVWLSKVQRGDFRHQRFPAASGRGARDPQILSKVSPMANDYIPIQNATARGVRSGPKMSENVQF